MLLNMSTHSASARLGVDVCLAQPDEKDVPQCPHGPMLLFERFFKDGRPPRKFYACSACRDRKDCVFFQWQDEKITEARRHAHKEIIECSKPSPKQTKPCEELSLLLSSPKNKGICSWSFCHCCHILVVNSESEEHKGHDVQRGDNIEELRHPSLILKPNANVKAHAQFLFSSKSTRFFVSLIRKLGFTKVICLGTPRIHEKIQFDRSIKGRKKKSLDSILLDIDFRYGQFNQKAKYCRYNMFNHHFFNEEGQKIFHNFLKCPDDEKIVLIMDPPFGGLVEILAATVNKIWTIWREQNGIDKESGELPTLWIFPYFMESHIQKSIPSLKMMDYKVDYENHPHFKGKQDKGSKRGSPVRMFTNIKPCDIKLPADEGYKYCKICKRFVAPENQHCEDCGSCTSKDGRRYLHCIQCTTCVKPGRSHCATCNRCELPSHDCLRSSSVAGCHICGEVGHKRKECPSKIVNAPKSVKKKEKCAGKKRKLNGPKESGKQKRRKKN